MDKSEGNEDRKRGTFWKIDRQTLPYKIHFFLFVGAMGTLMPYQPSIGITRLGLGAGNLAVVFTVQQFLLIVFKPLIGYIVDYFNNLKGMMVTLTVLNGVLSYLLLAIPKIDHESVTHLNESQSRLQSAQTNFCKLCNISNEIERAVQFLPKSTDKFENGISCEDSNILQKAFVSHCLQANASSPFNATYKAIFKTCNVSTKEPTEKSRTNLVHDSQNNYVYITYLSQNHDHILLQFTVMCRVRNIGLDKINFTLDYITKSCYAGPSGMSLLDTTLGTPENIVCRGTKENSDVTLEVIKENSFRTYQFWLYTLFLITSCTCISIIFTLSDTACCESVQTTGGDYGKQRAWGSIGWGLMAPFGGFLNDYTDSYLASMILMTILCALQIWNLTKINLIKPQFSHTILKDVKTVLSSVDFAAFEMGVLLNGMGIGIVWFFLPWFITDIGGSRVLIGLAHAVQCFLGDVPFMTISGAFIKKIGHFNVVSMALAAHCVRFLLYSFLKNPWLILPIECLDGITFAAFYTAMTSYGKLNSKPGTEATTQSLLCSTYEGLGAGLGCVIAGVCFDYYGGYTTFFYAGLCFAAAAAINIGSSVLLHFRKVSKETNCDSDRY